MNKLCLMEDTQRCLQQIRITVRGTGAVTGRRRQAPARHCANVWRCSGHLTQPIMPRATVTWSPRDLGGNIACVTRTNDFISGYITTHTAWQLARDRIKFTEKNFIQRVHHRPWFVLDWRLKQDNKDEIYDTYFIILSLRSEGRQRVAYSEFFCETRHCDFDTDANFIDILFRPVTPDIFDMAGN